jgi:hypothetical protein
MIPNNPPPKNTPTDNPVNNKNKSTNEANSTYSAFNYKVNINDSQPQIFIFSNADINTDFNIHDRDTKKINEDFNAQNNDFMKLLFNFNNLNLFGNQDNKEGVTFTFSDGTDNSIPKIFGNLFEDIFNIENIALNYDMGKINTALENLELTNHDVDNLTEKHVNTAYHKLSKKYHPDRNPETSEKFIKITEAKEFLLEYLEQKK